jgi:hypothetical protein
MISAPTATTARQDVTCRNHDQRVAVDSKNADLLPTAPSAAAEGYPPHCGGWRTIFSAPFLQFRGRVAVVAVVAVDHPPSRRVSAQCCEVCGLPRARTVRLAARGLWDGPVPRQQPKPLLRERPRPEPLPALAGARRLGWLRADRGDGHPRVAMLTRWQRGFESIQAEAMDEIFPPADSGSHYLVIEAGR